jgi:bifunctional non-homologous end joining protein LigD
LARYQHPDRPTVLVFDLDPGSGVDVIDCAEVALWLREFLQKHRLECFPKTSGSKGLQVYAPLNTAVTFEQTKRFARYTAEQLTVAHPDRVIQRMEKRLRQGKIFIDWSQNDAHKTTVCVYSLRAMEQPTVSTPLTWDEVAEAASRSSNTSVSFLTEEALQRIEDRGDLFEPVLKVKQKLPQSA